MSATKSRPFGVTILVIGAAFLAFMAVIHTLQALGILPYFISPGVSRGFSLFNAIMWGLMVWVYVWLVRMLLDMDPSAWLFLAVITIFNLILDFTLMLGAAGWSDVSISFIVNALVLIYIMLPGVRHAFGQR